MGRSRWDFDEEVLNMCVENNEKNLPSPEKRREVRNRYFNGRRKSDYKFHMAERCRRILLDFYRRTPDSKSSKTHDELGYSLDEFLEHIESRFVNGMCWENRQDWEIDHANPVTKMLKSGVDSPSKVNALDNLLPMWREDNRLKRDMTLKEFLDKYPEKRKLYGHHIKEGGKDETN